MLETWFVKTRSVFSGRGPRCFRWIRIFPPGIWIIMTVVAVVGLRLFWVEVQRPAHRQEITAAFGGARWFNGSPQMNHDGSRITYVATCERGYALFLCDTASGRKEIIYEENGLGEFGQDFHIKVWPWSPDDHSFIYTTEDKLLICSAQDKLSKPAVIEVKRILDVIWLNPSAIVGWDGKTIHYAKKSEGGDWKTQKLPYEGQIQNLTAIDDHTIAWLQDGYICHLDLTQGLENSTSSRRATLDSNAMPPTADLKLWLDASTLQQPDKTPVTILADLSAQQNQAIVNRNPPSYNAPDNPNALRGKGTIHFKSGNVQTTATGLKTTRPLGIVGSHPRSVFAVMRRDPGRSMLVSIGSLVTNGGSFSICDQNNSLHLPLGGFGAKEAGRKALPSSWRILEAIYDGTNCSSFINGGSSITTSLRCNTVDKVVEIGLRTARFETNTTPASGDFAELLIYQRALSDAEQRRVEHYLNAKWFGDTMLSPQSPLVWLDPGLPGLNGFSYSKETGRFLLSCAKNDQSTVWFIDTQTVSKAEATQMAQGVIRGSQWTGPGKFAYISEDLIHPGLVLKDLSGSEEDRLLERARFDWFKLTADQKAVFFFGTASNEPASGIWQYDLGSRQLRSVIPGLDHPSAFARNLVPMNGSIKLPSGRSVNCTIYPPPPWIRRNKYPLVLGNTVLLEAGRGAQRRLWLQNVASCGAFVVVIRRNDWFKELEQWEATVLGVYQRLTLDPRIDSKEVYLFGASAETEYLGACAAKTPGLWKGLILLNPGVLPDFSTAPPLQARPKILISAGSEEHRDTQYKQYQTNLMQSGVCVELIVHPGVQHHLFGNAAQLDRAKAITHFVFEE